ncbi:MAG: TolC family protein [Treponema sp.]|nr:TolC family protein [Treponema sp.]
MGKIQPLLLCFSLVLAASPVPAQEGQVSVLTLERACELAEKNSITLKKQALDLELDRVGAKNLWAQIFPSIGVSGGANYSIPLNNGAPRADPSYTVRVGLSLNLGAGLPYTMANLSLAYKKGLLDYEQVRRQLANQTAKTFYSLLVQKNSLLVLEGAERIAADQLQRDRLARQNGYLGELDFLSSSLSVENAKLEYSRALSNYRSALGAFLTTLGLDQEEEPELEGTVEIEKLVLDAEGLIRTGLSRHSGLAARRNEIERLKNAGNETFLSAKGPSVSLSASLGASLADGFEDTASAGISLSIPVDPWIPRSRRDQEVQRARTGYEKALLDLWDQERTLRQEIRNAVEALENTWTEVEIARLQADYARRAFELAEQSYRLGTMNFLNFETLRNRLTEARQRLFQNELDYKILALDFASSLNMDIGELKDFSYGDIETGEGGER